MIGYLRGSLLRSAPDRLLLDVGGVGFEVHVSLPTYEAVMARPGGSDVELFIHTHLREDGIALFGFSCESERRFFELLLGIGGIGPKLARNILSGAPLAELVAAIAAADVARLARTPGVGKKTAERIVLELRDKLGKLDLDLPAPSRTSSVGADLASALVNLGYRPADAERAVAEASREAPDADFQDLLRSSLRRLSRS